MDIVFSANNMQETLTLPIIPPDFQFSIPRKNEEFETIGQGTLNLIGLRGLKTLSISSFFPLKTYRFAKHKKDGWSCVRFFNKWANKRLPIRIIVTDNKSNEIVNMACTVESFTYGLDRAGDIAYTLDLKEFVFVKVT
ncbi:hypothetical protein [Paenibacillus aquistagni]|uniref:Phage tail tube protein n=1 Tax=Paenibacillus aquistagni TaxID=1852522 RepID=A0A1X7LY26_9BACL|nr:hypothetical protein [Paenibacillus aquistagni]NMM52156.1 phage portal protein [Paenibacillus aquistagni]SMG58193.1 hypothetical protein SAMN06295960_4641 [Paenibacillus aquistagni]